MYIQCLTFSTLLACIVYSICSRNTRNYLNIQLKFIVTILKYLFTHKTNKKFVWCLRMLFYFLETKILTRMLDSLGEIPIWLLVSIWYIWKIYNIISLIYFYTPRRPDARWWIVTKLNVIWIVGWDDRGTGRGIEWPLGDCHGCCVHRYR